MPRTETAESEHGASNQIATLENWQPCLRTRANRVSAGLVQQFSTCGVETQALQCILCGDFAPSELLWVWADCGQPEQTLKYYVGARWHWGRALEWVCTFTEEHVRHVSGSGWERHWLGFGSPGRGVSTLNDRQVPGSFAPLGLPYRGLPILHMHLLPAPLLLLRHHPLRSAPQLCSYITALANSILTRDELFGARAG